MIQVAILSAIAFQLISVGGQTWRFSPAVGPCFVTDTPIGHTVMQGCDVTLIPQDIGHYSAALYLDQQTMNYMLKLSAPVLSFEGDQGHDRIAFGDGTGYQSVCDESRSCVIEPFFPEPDQWFLDVWDWWYPGCLGLAGTDRPDH